MFSVIIPLYNKEISIKNTIISVLDQTYNEFEIVIVNDGSTDASIAVVEGFTDPRIRVVYQENQGVSSARNRGIKEAKYEWIAFLDGDDLWGEQYLQSVHDMMDKYPDESIFCSGFATLDNKGNILERFSVKKEGILENYFKTVNQQKRYILHTSAIVVKKKCLISVSMFNPSLTHGEDLDLWERLARQFSFVINTSIMTFYRIGAENRSNQSVPKVERTRIYNLDSSRLVNVDEIEYYRNGVLSSMYSSLRNHNLKRFIQIKRRHNTLIEYKDILRFLLLKLKKKVK